jgi:hypothetical protein
MPLVFQLTLYQAPLPLACVQLSCINFTFAHAIALQNEIESRENLQECLEFADGGREDGEIQSNESTYHSHLDTRTIACVSESVSVHVTRECVWYTMCLHVGCWRSDKKLKKTRS